MASLRRFVFKIELLPLRPDQALALLHSTLGTQAGSLSSRAEAAAHARLSRAGALTPGDFSAAARRLAALGGRVNADELLDAVEEEVAARGKRSKNIGFSRIAHTSTGRG